MSAPPRPGRAGILDAARGIAILGMIGYHASWFAADDGLVHIDFAEPGWRLYQRLVAGAFFLLVGVSVELARENGVTFHHFAARSARIAGCALVVTLTSLLLDPARLVTFGVLHCIFVSSLLAWPLRRFGLGVLPFALFVLALGALPGDARFDTGLRWTGLGTTQPPTFDFQPLFPWFGMVLVGLAAATIAPRRLWTWRPTLLAPLEWLGRRSLFVYMAHVPVLMALSESAQRCLQYWV